MLCSKCGAQISDGSKFCNECGNPVENNTQKKQSKMNKQIVWIIILSLVLIMLIVVTIALLLPRRDKSESITDTENLVSEAAEDVTDNNTEKEALSDEKEDENDAVEETEEIESADTDEAVEDSKWVVSKSINILSDGTILFWNEYATQSSQWTQFVI